MNKLKRLGVLLRKPPIATLLALVTAGVAVGNGSSMLLDPQFFWERPEYNIATAMFSPFVWGMILLGLALWLVITMWRKTASHMPVMLLCVTYSLFAALMALSTIITPVGSSPVWLLIGAAAYTWITQFALREEHDHAVAETPTDHK
jgi:hypothetical protein